MNLKTLSLILCLGHTSLHAKEVVNDVTQINPIVMNRIVSPKSIRDIQDALKNSTGPVSIGGGRYSMGGQTAIEHGVQLDMTRMNRVLSLDLKTKTITVEAGIRWRDIQDHVDRHDLSVKIMQTYSNFTVGGSLSVNAHGRYVGKGPVIMSVDSFKLVLADGKLVEASPENNPEIFYGAIGGYGALGVIAEVTLQLEDNVKLESKVIELKLKDYPKYFTDNVKNNPDYVFHNGDLYPPEYERVRALSWIKTTKPLTETKRLIDRNEKHFLVPLGVGFVAVAPGGKKLREKVIDPYLSKTPQVVWRNFEASYDVASLEPLHRKFSTYVLQEYFIPVKNLESFVPKMKRVFSGHDVNVVNVSIRHALPDPGSLMAWAREEVFSLVIYIRQGITRKDKLEAGVWTRAMIQEVLSEKGTYYLPYQIHATQTQFESAYPNSRKFFELKKKLDPTGRFRNQLWERYLPKGM